MPSLQIRNLPEDVYQALAFRAERAHRSLAQQALIELRKATASEGPERRRQLLSEIRASLAVDGTRPLSVTPEELIRTDRAR